VLCKTDTTQARNISLALDVTGCGMIRKRIRIHEWEDGARPAIYTSVSIAVVVARMVMPLSRPYFFIRPSGRSYGSVVIKYRIKRSLF